MLLDAKTFQPQVLHVMIITFVLKETFVMLLVYAVVLQNLVPIMNIVRNTLAILELEDANQESLLMYHVVMDHHVLKMILAILVVVVMVLLLYALVLIHVSITSALVDNVKHLSNHLLLLVMIIMLVLKVIDVNQMQAALVLQRIVMIEKYVLLILAKLDNVFTE